MKMVVQVEEWVHENRDATLCDLGNVKAVMPKQFGIT